LDEGVLMVGCCATPVRNTLYHAILLAPDERGGFIEVRDPLTTHFPGDGRAPPRRPPDRLSVEDTHPLSVVPGRGICGARLCVCALRFGGYGVGVTHTRSPVREKDIQLNFEADRQGLKCLPFLEPN